MVLSDAQQLLAKIEHIATPADLSVDQIEKIQTVDLLGSALNPDFKEGASKENARWITGAQAFEKLLAQNWKTLQIVWARGDGEVNYNQPPTINHKLIAVMVKLKE